MNRRNNPSARAFTLVELLVVIGIIAVLVSLLLPALNKAVNSAEAITCQSNMRQIGMWAFMYINDNQGQLPVNGGNATYRYGAANEQPFKAWFQKHPSWKQSKHSGTVLFCPTVSKYIGRNTYTGVEASSAYALNYWLGGGKDLTGATVSARTPPYEKLRVKQLKLDKMWFAEAPVHPTYPAYPGYAYMDYAQCTYGPANPWPWQGTQSRLGRASHPGGQAFFMFGDGHVEGITKRTYNSWSNKVRDRFNNLSDNGKNW